MSDISSVVVLIVIVVLLLVLHVVVYFIYSSLTTHKHLIKQFSRHLSSARPPKLFINRTLQIV